MSKVYCADVECVHNSIRGCKVPEVSLSTSHIYTVHEGVKHIWVCKNYEMSEEAKEIYDALRNLVASAKELG